MSIREFVKIPAEELVEFLAKHGLKETKPFAGERIFIHEYDTGKALIVYSSLPVSGGAVRDRGTDAIRLVVRNDKTGNHRKAGKILRINTWRNNLHDKIMQTLIKFHLFNTPTCAECGSQEVNGITDDGELVCAYHELPVFRGDDVVLVRVSAWGM